MAEAERVSKLVGLVDDYRARHGWPSEASVSRAIGVAPQTVNSWRNRGVRKLPDKVTMRRLAEFLNVSHETVLLAAATDAGYLEPSATPPPPPPPPQPQAKPRATGTEGR